MKAGSILASAGKIGWMLVLAAGLAAQAGEVRVIGGPALAVVMPELSAQFERATGHKVVMTYELSGGILRRFNAGEDFDVTILGDTSTIDALVKAGKVGAAARSEIARVGMGVGARGGAPKPDIGSEAAFRRALLDARSITYAPEGLTGRHMVGVLERLGIAQQMQIKTRPVQQPERVPQAVAAGEAELGFGFTTVLLSVPGVELVGPFPPELQRVIVFTAGAVNAQPSEAAQAWIKFLVTPQAVAIMKEKGFDPPVR